MKRWEYDTIHSDKSGLRLEWILLPAFPCFIAGGARWAEYWLAVITWLRYRSRSSWSTHCRHANTRHGLVCKQPSIMTGATQSSPAPAQAQAVHRTISISNHSLPTVISISAACHNNLTINEHFYKIFAGELWTFHLQIFPNWTITWKISPNVSGCFWPQKALMS